VGAIGVVWEKAKDTKKEKNNVNKLLIGRLNDLKPIDLQVD
jgi:hypothetical protein